MRISIIGAGWFGLSLGKTLHMARHHVLGTTRGLEKFPELQRAGIQPRELCSPQIPDRELLDADAVVLNFPPFLEQLLWLRTWPWQASDWPIFISSTSVYGDLTGVIKETSLRRPSTPNAAILQKTEDWIRTLAAKATIIRFGGLLGPDRHPGYHLAGRVDVLSGDSPVNLLHQEDAVGFTRLVIESRLQGKEFNLVSDEHTSRREFYTDFSIRNGLPAPTFLNGGDARIIENEAVKKIYRLRWPRLIGRSL